MDYWEIFDSGIGFSQLGFEAGRLQKVLDKFAGRMRDKHKGSEHLAG